MLQFVSFAISVQLGNPLRTLSVVGFPWIYTFMGMDFLKTLQQLAATTRRFSLEIYFLEMSRNLDK